MDGYHELQNNVAWHKFRKHADDIEPTEQIVLEEIKEEKQKKMADPWLEELVLEGPRHVINGKIQPYD